jgi:hypothetical protein
VRCAFAVNRRLDEWVQLAQLDLTSIIQLDDNGDGGRTRNQKRKMEFDVS